MEFTLLWAALTAAAALWAGTKVWDEGLPDNPLDRLLAAAVVGLVTGRLVAMIAQGVNPITNPLEFIVIRGGVSTPAAAAGAIGWLLWTWRASLSGLDAVAPAALLGLAGWHAGCIWRGACLGTPTDLPWGWSSSISDLTRHPVEIYAALLLAVGAFAVARLGRRPLLRFGTALAVAGLARLFTEPMRPSLTGGPIGWYILAVVAGIGVATFGSRLTGEVETHAPT